MQVQNYYDVIIIGDSLSAYLLSALLLNRKYAVYHIGTGTIHAGPGAFRIPQPAVQETVYPGFLEKPYPKQVLDELNLRNEVRNALRTTTAAYQLLGPGHRLDIRGDRDGLYAELEREWPGRLPRTEFDSLTAALNENDQFISEWLKPDSGLFQKSGFLFGKSWRFDERQAADFFSQLEAQPFHAQVGEFHRRHPWLGELFALPLAFSLPLTFASLDPGLASRQLAGLMLEPLASLEGDELKNRIRERIRRRVGLTEEGVEITAIEVGRKEVVVEERRRQARARFLVAALPIHLTARIFSGIHKGFRKQMERFEESFQPVAHRYGFTVRLSSEVVPEGLGRTAFLDLPGQPAGVPDRLRIDVDPFPLDETTQKAAIGITYHVPAAEARGGGGLREQVNAILASLDHLFPYIDEFERTIYREEPADQEAFTLASEPVWGAVRGPGHRQFEGFPLDTPAPGLFFAGDEAFPQAGIEGHFIAAAEIASLIRERMPKSY